MKNYYIVMPGHFKLVYALLLRDLSDHCHQVVLLHNVILMIRLYNK